MNCHVGLKNNLLELQYPSRLKTLFPVDVPSFDFKEPQKADYSKDLEPHVKPSDLGIIIVNHVTTV